VAGTFLETRTINYTWIPLTVKSGKYAAVFQYDGASSNFKALGFNLPANYEGDTITLSGYIKTENVTDGYAGLWMRIDPEIAFDNMYNRGITGSTDWENSKWPCP
jgi:hypothetical protein